VPGVWDEFEAAVLAALGQNLTASGPRPLLGRFVRMFGTPVGTPILGLTHLFPTAEILAHPDLSKAGVGDASARAIRKISSIPSRKQLKLATAETLEQTISRVQMFCGVDQSTANYIAMRAFGEPDAFPSQDRGLRRRLSESGRIVSAAQALATAGQWRPWRAYAAMHLAQRGRN